MTKRYSWIFGAVMVLLLQGCVSFQEPAFDRTTTQIDTTEKSVFMLDVAFQNAYKANYQADSFKLKLVQKLPNAKTKDLFFSVNPTSFDSNTGDRVGLFNGSIEPGDYVVDSVDGIASSLLIIGSFSIPIQQTVTIPGNEVVYLGQIKAVNRKRQEGEFRSGIVIPLLDQAVAGFSGGTMDVEISNSLQTRADDLKGTYPALENRNIIPVTLEPFDRSRFDSK